MEKIYESFAVAKKVLEYNLNVKPTEILLIVIDSTKKELGDLFYNAGVEIGAETLLMQYVPRKKSGEEPPSPVADAMMNVDVAICITEHSISHTKARKKAAENNTRIATMPGLTLDMLTNGALKADYSDVRKIGEQVEVVLDRGKHVVIETGDSVLTFEISGRKSKASTGFLINPGDSGNLPSGETYIAPIEGTANGEIRIDGSIAGIGLLKQPIILKLKDGKLIEAEGKEGQELLKLLGDGDGRYLCELGIGTNPFARFTGNVLEDEKKYGTCHIAFGTNHNFGGIINAGVHIDAVIKRPKVFIDGNVFVSNGEIHL
ncbi:aminopeptidase [Sporosarcina sp. FA9]|uniref:aminopeptidase n=1 Tax=Sporosarcina sp. FA9 TaxID=3413030 RepID=UPI003F65794E